MLTAIPFPSPAPAATSSSKQSTTKQELPTPMLSLTPRESEQLKSVVERIVILSLKNPFAAVLAVNITATVLDFFDA